MSSDLEGTVLGLQQELAEARCKQDLAEQRYQELHHRTRNDLQRLTSLLSLQASRKGYPGCSNCVARAKGVFTLHRMLDGETQQAPVAMSAYLGRLANTLMQAFDRQVTIEVAADDASLDGWRAGEVGLIFNEAVMNALKHAFNGREDGTIAARFRRDGDRYELIVADDGNGFDRDQAEPGMGLQLMRWMANRLDGVLDLPATPAGSTLRLQFPS